MDHARRFAPRCLVVVALLALPALPAFASRPAPTPPPAASDGRWFDRGMELHEDEKWDEAIAAFRRAIDAGERVGVSSFNVACAYARKGEKDLAFEWLGRAEAAGFELRRHLDDRDLDSLRTDSRFTALKAKARSARAPSAAIRASIAGPSRRWPASACQALSRLV